PDPERLLRTLHQATRAFRDTPARHGYLLPLAGAVDVLVAGDLHGNIENFRRLMELADLRTHPDRHLVFQELIHGPHRYPNGGDKSHQAVDLLAALKCQFPRQVHMLLGNHELAQTTGQWIAKGDYDLNQLFLQGVETAYGPRANKLYAASLDLFSALPLAVRTANRVFLSHSLPRADRLDQVDLAVLERDKFTKTELMPGGPVHSLVWGRDTAPANVTAFLQKMDADLLITGHIPCREGFAVPNERQIILDSLGTPAGYCLFRADRPLTHPELVGCVKTF